MLRSLLIGCSLLLVTSSLTAQNWPGWRGPQGVGTTAETGFPIKWSATENIRWQAPLPGPGNSTPVVWENHIFVTCASTDGKQRSLICFDRENGKQRWQKTVSFPTTEVTHKTNPQCASSPVTDGKQVVAWFGSAGLYAYDMDGKMLWKRDLGKFEHIWGTASSPIIFEDLVIANCGPGLRAFWIALNKQTGDEVWRWEPPEAKSDKLDEFRGSWSTPVIDGTGDQALMFLSMPTQLYAVEPRTGKVRWSCGGLSKLIYTSPLVTKDTVAIMCGYHGPSLAVRRGGQGDVTKSHRLWLMEGRQANPQRIGSGTIVGDHIYILNETGIAWCIELKTGKKLWEQRLGKAKSWSSMCYVEGRLYIVNMDGVSFVLEPDPKACKILAENRLEGLTRGSLAFSQGHIFMRTYNELICIGNE